MNHYYFKSGKGNEFFKKYLHSKKKEKFIIEDIIPLPIYFGPWTIEDYHNGTAEISGKNRPQVETFLKCAKKEKDSSVFWIFHDYIYALSPVGEIYNGNPSTGTEYTQAKIVNSKVVAIFEKEALPERLTTINANQKYNRKTIVKIDGSEERICEWIFEKQKGKMQISDIERGLSHELCKPVHTGILSSKRIPN